MDTLSNSAATEPEPPRRPGSAGISEADEYIFRTMYEAAAGRETMPWAFYMTGPDGVQELTEHDVGLLSRKAAATPKRLR